VSPGPPRGQRSDDKEEIRLKGEEGLGRGTQLETIHIGGMSRTSKEGFRESDEFGGEEGRSAPFKKACWGE